MHTDISRPQRDCRWFPMLTDDELLTEIEHEAPLIDPRLFLALLERGLTERLQLQTAEREIH